jgi:hypothetical protein
MFKVTCRLAWEKKVRRTQLSLEDVEGWKYEAKHYGEKSVCSNVSTSSLLIKTEEYNSVRACVYMCVCVIFLSRTRCYAGIV